jgi:hypothetical protein
MKSDGPRNQLPQKIHQQINERNYPLLYLIPYCENSHQTFVSFRVFRGSKKADKANPPCPRIGLSDSDGQAGHLNRFTTNEKDIGWFYWLA